jgi:hypothetical protein
MSDIQEQVQETLDELVASGAELGIQAVAYRDGIKVVDAVAGVGGRTGGYAGHCLLQLLYRRPWYIRRSTGAPSDTTRLSWSCGRSSVLMGRRTSPYATC